MKSKIFTAKGTFLRESTSIEPFCVKIGWGVWPLGLWGKKKSESHARLPYRNEVSPLTQGAACDTFTLFIISWRCFDSSLSFPRITLNFFLGTITLNALEVVRLCRGRANINLHFACLTYLMKLLVARRTNNRRVVGSSPAIVVCITVHR